MANKKFETLDGINSNGAVTVANTLTVSGNLAVNTSTLVVNVSANNVGVNTAPTSIYALDVNGNMRATSYFGNGSQLTGLTADNANTVGGISASQFLRSDIADAYESGSILSISNNSTFAVTSGSVRINTNQGFGFGTGSDVLFSYNGTRLNVTGGDVSFDNNTLFIDVSGNNVGVNTAPAAAYALDVSGAMRATSFVGDGSGLTNVSTVGGGNADTVGGLSASQFLRSDTTDTHTSGTLIINSSGVRVNTNVGLRFGTSSNFTFLFDGSKLNASGSNVAIDTSTLFVNAVNKRVGIGTTNPARTLDVNGAVGATTYFGDGSNLTGIVTGGGNADTLDGLDSSVFLRSNVEDLHNGGTLIFSSGSLGLRMNDNIPLRFGTGSDIQFNYNGTQLNVTGGDIVSSGKITGNTIGIGSAIFTYSPSTTVQDFYTNQPRIGLTDPSTNISINGKISAGVIGANNFVCLRNQFGEGGEIAFIKGTGGRGAFIDLDSSNNFRVISDSANIIFQTATNTVAGRFNGTNLTITGNIIGNGSIRAKQGGSSIDNSSAGFTFQNDADTGMFNVNTSQDSGTLTFKCNNSDKFIINGVNNTISALVANFNVTGTVTSSSDERLKDDIETLDGSKVYSMRGVSYTKDGVAGSGVIAQEMQSIAPELVISDGEYLSVAYGNLVGYLIESVKLLKSQVDSLQQQVNDLST
jgi:hypothetical protein